jgi:hypothetical protein
MSASVYDIMYFITVTVWSIVYLCFIININLFNYSCTCICCSCNCICIVFIVCSVLYCLCSFVWCVSFECGVLFRVMCYCVLCLIVVPLPPGKNQFVV